MDRDTGQLVEALASGMMALLNQELGNQKEEMERDRDLATEEGLEGMDGHQGDADVAVDVHMKAEDPQAVATLAVESQMQTANQMEHLRKNQQNCLETKRIPLKMSSHKCRI